MNISKTQILFLYSLLKSENCSEQLIDDTIDPTGDASVLFTLRVLSGEMSGSELLLSEERYLIKTGKQSPNKQDSESESAITLFVPSGNTGNSYYLDLTGGKTTSSDIDEGKENDTVSNYSIINSSSSDTEKPIYFEFNRIIQVDDLILAIKKESEIWDESVTNYIHIVNEDYDDDIPADKRRKLKQQSKTKLKKFTAPAGILALVCIVTAGFWFNSSKSEQAIKRSLTETIAGSVNPVSIIKSKKNTYYLLAQTQRDMDWILQALQKNPRPNDEKIKVILLAEEPEQLTNKFWDKEYPVLTVDLSSPRFPTVKIITGPDITPDKLKKVKAQALAWMPFAEDVVIKTYNKNTIISTAEDGLKLIYLPFAKLSTPQGATFSIRGALSDNDLLQLNHFINTYQNTWGSRYIKFDIKLDNDLLKGKSYLNGQQGYVLMGKSHWYFPSI